MELTVRDKERGRDGGESECSGRGGETGRGVRVMLPFEPLLASTHLSTSPITFPGLALGSRIPSGLGLSLCRWQFPSH